jgi:DNA (cytosine-5)-methyltransferase 1
MRLLDLYCGAGGCSVGYERVGFEVVGVDIRPQPRYPFAFIRADVLDVLGCGNFDAVHASPPCQAHTAMRTMPNASEHRNLIPETRKLLRETGLPYVIENVRGAPLENPVEICGAALGLRSATHDLARHRLFECNFPLLAPPCSHGSRPVVGFYGDNVRDARRLPGEADRRLKDMATDREGKLRWGREAMGIDWMEWEELVQAIPPAYTEHIGHFLMAELRARAAA